jgi:hypothetical protein
MKYLFIDIRKSDEVYSKHFDQSKEYSFYNIPMNMIRFNAENIIQHLEYVDEIYIVCQSAARSNFIKNKYFKNYDKIKVNNRLQFAHLNHGMNTVYLDENKKGQQGQGQGLNINIIGSNSFNFYNVMRITQTIMGSLMILIGLYIYTQLQKDGGAMNKIRVPLFILVAFGSMVLFNGLTSTCSLSILLENELN